MYLKSDTMNLRFVGDVGYLTFKRWEKYDFIRHCYSTRLGGVSENEFSTMNLGAVEFDSPENVEENYKIFCDALGYERNMMVNSHQVHGNKIKAITSSDIENNNLDYEGIDGFVTDIPNVVLKTMHADCCPIYMLDPELKVVGLAHAGWRGTVAKIAEKLAEKFVVEFGSKKENIVCAVGPSIGKCCFEVGEDVQSEFKNLGLDINFEPQKYNPEKYKIDLKEVNKRILVNFGIPIENIIKSDVCTMCNKELLFSHRASHGKRGNNGAFISIKK